MDAAVTARWITAVIAQVLARIDLEQGLRQQPPAVNPINCPSWPVAFPRSLAETTSSANWAWSVSRSARSDDSDANGAGLNGSMTRCSCASATQPWHRSEPVAQSSRRSRGASWRTLLDGFKRQ